MPIAQGVVALLGVVAVLLGGCGVTVKRANLAVIGAALLAVALFWEPLGHLWG
jgi:hypothetical protein